MYLDMSGKWNISLQEDTGERSGDILLPGILQAQGYGNEISIHTPWVSSLHDDFWYEQEEFKFAQEDGVKVPFLAQPPKHFTGKAYYRKIFCIEENAGRENGFTEEEISVEENWYFYMELAKWRSTVWVDGEEKGGDVSLCAPHEICLGRLSEGEHELLVCLDNSMQYPYRPDGHGISDALGAAWNGMVGEIALYGEKERRERKERKRQYAAEHKRTVRAEKGKFVIDGQITYFRATHFGGEFPLTGYPVTEVSWWREKMQIIKSYGLNGIRFHSFCPPEAAFLAADEEGVLLLVECGMWNHFTKAKAGDKMREVLRRESRKILDAFGHHPSFVFFSSGNEPSGDWYEPLKDWVRETGEYDKAIGYGGRRIYTAQSGWFYDSKPAEITGTDFVYFHRSAYGPLPGGVIRNFTGWKGKDYSPSLEGCKLPVVGHELGQWCSYPDFSVIEKFKGYLRPGNYEIFKESAKKAGLLPLNRKMAVCSGENQFRLYKEDIEASLRTREIEGFELLDLHDYLGQGTALVGFLDAFWEPKNEVTPERFRQILGDTVLLARCPSYCLKAGEEMEVPVEISHYGRQALTDARLDWRVVKVTEEILREGEILPEEIRQGENTHAGNLKFSVDVSESCLCRLELTLTAKQLEQPVRNSWAITVFAEKRVSKNPAEVVATKDWKEAKAALEEGKRVLYTPYLTSLDYECPALSIKNVFWNSQLGPTWSRPLGLIVEKENVLFQKFPTEESGGWQWEDILRQSRGFRLDGLEGAEVLVRAIDDWNRNLSLGLIWQARVGKGSLLVASANLEGSFIERPAAYSLKQELLSYIASEHFRPEGEVTVDAVEEKLFPTFRSFSLVEKPEYEKDVLVQNGDALIQPNPNSFVRLEKESFPIVFGLNLKRPVAVKGLLTLPVQRDRAHEGFIREYEVFYFNKEENSIKSIACGTLKNSCRSEKILFDREVTTEQLLFVVKSAYGCVRKMVWQNEADGWRRVEKEPRAIVQLAGLHLLCGEAGEESDDLFWEKDQKSNTKEIEA